MSYQVLARKWRPKNFQELMGQEHVVSVLANALAQKRLHHAYLFTGTRGVGKTTIARIFAKSLNCDTGITDKPCGTCDTCVDIDQGRFVDLLEIDAASKTKVDDTREILDNVQYAPSRGRFKVYLIDEVHMLSRHSFNALLKTLEEPPEHVKFILATTDPQKLPITVLSRCLQFHLKALTVKQIEEKLAEILTSEQVGTEPGCLTLLAKAARGSMRDSLSLTDQAIAQGQGNISLVNVQQMLGGIDQNWVYQLVTALLKQDSQALMALSQEIASYAPNYSRLFAELIQLFHQIALMQIVEQHFDLPADLLALLKQFSQVMPPEDVQLFYQISLNGRKDLPYASDEQAAFDMTLLRLFAFKPMQKSQLDTDTRFSALNNKSSDVTLSSDDQAVANEAKIAEPKTIESAVAASKLTASEVTMPAVAESKLAEPKVAESKVAEAVIDSVSNDSDVQAPSPAVQTESSLAKELPTQVEQVQQADLNEQMLEIEQQAATLHQSVAEQVEPLEAISTNPHEVQSNSASFANEQLQVKPQQAPDNHHGEVQQNSTPSVINEQTQSTHFANQQVPVEQSSVVTEQVTAPPSAMKAEPLAIDSPVSSVLATRNMLRSRKKELEKQAKKPSDANARQTPTTEQASATEASNTQANDSETDTPKPAAKVVSVPEPEVPFHQDSIDPAKVTKANQVDKWAHMIDSMQLTARIRQLAIHATISEQSTDDNLILQLNQATRHLNTEVAQQQLQSYICEFLSKDITVTLNVVEDTVADPYQIQGQINDKRLEYAKGLIKDDAVVVALQEHFQASIAEDTISAR